MSESDTMFNERDRRCAAVQLILVMVFGVVSSEGHIMPPSHLRTPLFSLQLWVNSRTDYVLSLGEGKL